ncbi:bifunctional (p)ppGpp synthetase/guanosine-3',5'-bis(diphosphate) 3'-pyrophosphohydrolase [Candidatus Woesearchaeota archaeon]|nr:bifunctional (p)ppGpp synthetase/guanosine-3',5'-bis(diphosphate) 3'-pyrophosphohydrolase [Candidatus Woesearchaeota archaeon]
MAFDKKPITFEEFIELVRKQNPKANVDLIRKAFDFAKTAHAGQLRASGEEYFTHPLEVARILMGIRADAAMICAALLHDTVEDTSTSIETVQREFGDEIARLVEGLTKITGVQFESKEQYRAENLRKILIATTRDIRVMLIRLADRLHNIRTLDSFREEKRKRIARETLDIYAPIAHKLGIWKIKGELEDLALRYLDLEAYLKIKEQIAERRVEREKVAAEIVQEISSALQKEHINAEVSGRAKYFYSIYKKMLSKQKEFDQIYDLLAIRIITNTVPECYKALDVVHTTFEPLLDRFKDYIEHPKANGYQSIHTTVMYKGKMLEVQIRTGEMHHVAEYGVYGLEAAHWAYKGTAQDSDLFDRKIAWLKQVLDWKRKSQDATQFVENLKIDLFENEIIVFTPKGDPISLPEGATPVDFAFAVHSELGNHCSKAKVNSKIEPLDHELNSGDVIEIISQNNAAPSRTWLNFCKTQKAKSKIRAALDIEIEHKPKEARLRFEQREFQKQAIHILDYIKVVGAKGPLKVSKCCEPRFGEDIVGFFTKEGKITIHKTDCINIHTLDAGKKVAVSWMKLEGFGIRRLRVFINDRPGVLADILNLFAHQHINVHSVNTKSKKKKIVLNFKVNVGENVKLDPLIALIRSIPDVTDVRLSTPHRGMSAVAGSMTITSQAWC